jgi:tRNA 2-thiouridine synthesizing protein E
VDIDSARDVEGYLVEPDDWSEETAIIFAKEEQITLTTQHWKIIGFMRDYYRQHGIAADVRHVATFMAKELGVDKKLGKKRVFELFPYGYVKQACKIAGMKKPRAWSTG